MRRREFISGLGGVVAWPCAARAQKAPIPIGFLSSGTAASANTAIQIATIKQGLLDNGLAPTVEPYPLLYYGADYSELIRSAAEFITKIMKGTGPGDLPIQQPSKFKMGVNLKTAKAIGLIIPPELLARATEVIE